MLRSRAETDARAPTRVRLETRSRSGAENRSRIELFGSRTLDVIEGYEPSDGVAKGLGLSEVTEAEPEPGP